MNRQSFIGGSDIAGIMGVSPWRTPLSIFVDKVYPHLKEDRKTAAMQRGNELENTILDWHASKTDIKSIRPITIKSSTYPFMIAHLDAWDEKNGIVIEAKTSSTPFYEIPEYYKTQIAYYMALTNSNIAHMPTFFTKKNRFENFIYQRDWDFEEKIIKKTIDFWNNHVKLRLPPDVQAVSDYELVRRIDNER